MAPIGRALRASMLASVPDDLRPALDSITRSLEARRADIPRGDTLLAHSAAAGVSVVNAASSSGVAFAPDTQLAVAQEAGAAVPADDETIPATGVIATSQDDMATDAVSPEFAAERRRLSLAFPGVPFFVVGDFNCWMRDFGARVDRPAVRCEWVRAWLSEHDWVRVEPDSGRWTTRTFSGGVGNLRHTLAPVTAAVEAAHTRLDGPDVGTWQQRCEVVEDAAEAITRWVNGAAVVTAGRVRFRGGDGGPAVEEAHLAALKARRDAARATAEATLPGSYESFARWTEFRAFCRIVRAASRRFRRRMFSAASDDRLADAAGEAKRLRCNRQRAERGRSALDPARLPEYATHFRTTFGALPTASRVADADILQACDPSAPAQPLPRVSADWITSGDIELLCRAAARGKAPGPDSLFAPVLASLFQLFCRARATPPSWNIANVALVYKKKGSVDDVVNYRPISLISRFRMLFENLLRRQLEVVVEPLMDIAQDDTTVFARSPAALQRILAALHTWAIEHGMTFNWPGEAREIHAAVKDALDADGKLPTTSSPPKVTSPFSADIPPTHAVITSGNGHSELLKRAKQVTTAAEFQELEKSAFYAIRDRIPCSCGAQRSCEVAGDRTAATGVRRLTIRCRKPGCSSARFHKVLAENEPKLAAALNDALTNLAILRPATKPDVGESISAAIAEIRPQFIESTTTKPGRTSTSMVRRRSARHTNVEIGDNAEISDENSTHMEISASPFAPKSNTEDAEFRERLENMEKMLQKLMERFDTNETQQRTRAEEYDALADLERKLEAKFDRRFNEISKKYEDKCREVEHLRKELEEARRGLSGPSITNQSRHLETSITEQKRPRYPLSYAATAARSSEFPSTFDKQLEVIRTSKDDAVRKLALRPPPRERTSVAGVPRARAEFVAVAIRPGLSAAARAAGPLHSLRDFFRISGFPPLAYAKPIGKWALLFECWIDKKHIEKFRECCQAENVYIDEDFVAWKPSKAKEDIEESVATAENQYLSRMASMLTSVKQPINGSLRYDVLESVPERLRARLEDRIRKINGRHDFGNIAGATTAANEGSSSGAAVADVVMA
ncbi:hypothetical protein HK405_008512 [Cladochytrium tenue]|nr:hypothetical protein HK405_008512 [Cladochytrium tenue]